MTVAELVSSFPGMALIEVAEHERAALEVLPPPAPVGELAVLYRTVHDFFMKQVKTTLELSLPLAKQFKPLQNDVIWAYSNPRLPTKLNAELEGAALLLLAPFDEAQTVVPTLMASWLARGGWPFALQAVAKAFDAFIVSETLGVDRRVLLVPSEARLRVPPHSAFEAHLRGFLSRATPEEQATARAEVEALRQTGALATRSLFSCVFLDPEWLNADLAARVATKQPAFFTALALLRAGDGARVAQFLSVMHKEELQFISSQPLSHALLARFPDGVPLAALFERTVDEVRRREVYPRPFELMRALIETTKHCLDSSAAVTSVVAALTKLQDEQFHKDEDPRPALIALLRASPRLAVEPVQRAAAKKTAWAVALAPQLERMAEGGPATASPPVDAGAFWLPSAFAQPLQRTGTPLSAQEVEALGVALRRRNAEHLAEVKARCTPRSLAAFSWDLFSAWLAAGASAKGRWALQALGDFGDDTARRLTPLIREWPGEKAHQRARWGLDVLAAIGTDTALLMLDSVAQRVRHRAIQDDARDLMGAIAQRRGLTPEALSDRLVPDLGLDAAGSKTFSFGARSFRLGFDPNLKPFVTTDEGKRLADLPKPSAKDAPIAVRSVEAWKELKRIMKTEAPTVVLRFELAMAEERRWSMAEFQELFVSHPLLKPLVRSLLWGSFSNEGKLEQPFRVTTAGKLETVMGKPRALTLKGDALVGLVHPLRLTEEQAAVLGDTFESEFALPFEQLTRSVFTLTPKEWEAPSITRYEGRTTTSGRLRSLRERGWRLGDPADAGSIEWLTRRLGNFVVAGLHLDGLAVQGDSGKERVELGDIEFVDDLVDELNFHPELASRAPVDTRSPVAISELLRDLEAIVDPE